MMTSVIEFRGITKRFGRSDVLRGVDLSVASGRVMGLIGPNGAGKTTLLKLLLGLVHPTSGEILVGGTRIGKDDSYRAQIGYMPQLTRLPDNLTATELFAVIRGVRGDSFSVDHDIIERLRLGEHLDKPLKVLSGGTRQKVNAAMALYYRPSILVLDEPTSGLDALSSTTLKDTIRARRDEGATVLVTSHIMTELEELCDEVAFLVDGRVGYVGPIDELTARTRQSSLERAIASLMIREVA
jgi:Cu-processing system ATP-binding protein